MALSSGSTTGDSRRVWTQRSDPEHIYVLRYEAIGGYEAKLVIPLDASGGLTGVHFRAIDGLRLTLWGENLTPDQQRTALAILRTIRSSNEAAGRSPEESGASKPTPDSLVTRAFRVGSAA